MITKKELNKIDTAVEKAIAVFKPILARIEKSKDTADCLTISGYGNIVIGADKINKAKAIVK